MPSLGPDRDEAVQIVSKMHDLKDPYALSTNCFLAAHRNGIYVLDA